MKTCCALGRAICAATGVEVSCMLLGADAAVLGAGALGGNDVQREGIWCIVSQVQGKDISAP